MYKGLICYFPVIEFLFHIVQIKKSDSSCALSFTQPQGFMGSHTWPVLWLQKWRSEGLGQRGEGGLSWGEKSSNHLMRPIPFFMKKIKLSDLIKLSDVFVKLKKVFDVWWKEIEFSSDSVILECLPQVQLSCSKWLVMIKAA